jgi:glycosyltransferase involved in cell wall biosynthesis
VTITAAVIAQDEERHIASCVRGLTWADEVLVLDGGSVDRTADAARRAGARVEARRFDDFGHQRQAAIELARGEWLLFVDADERVSAGLAAEVRAATAAGDAVAYWIPRRNYIWGGWVRGGGWWPDAQLRLFRRGCATFPVDQAVHEVPRIEGRVGTLNCALVHYNYESVGQFVTKQRRYARLDADRRLARGETPRPKQLLSAPLREAHRRLVAEGGYVDGWRGVLLALLTALSVLETRAVMLSRARARR